MRATRGHEPAPDPTPDSSEPDAAGEPRGASGAGAASALAQMKAQRAQRQRRQHGARAWEAAPDEEPQPPQR